MLTASGLGTDYTLMGGQWDDSRTITYSFAPDGAYWDRGVNDANAKLDAEFGGTSWHALVAKALQTWSSVTNLNFIEVPDTGGDFDSSGVNEGDPKFGDIRIGGYDFGASTTIARTYGPPPNGQTGAGDVELNTAYNFAPGAGHDLETVVLHELGHALGLGESPQPSSVMYTYYSGVRQSLTAYDIEGVDSLYRAKAADGVQTIGQGISSSTAFDLTPRLDATGQAQLTGLSLSTIGDVEYFTITAPAINGSTLQVTASARGSSLLSPKVSIIDPSTGLTLASNVGPASASDVATASLANAQPGHRYIIAVTGASTDLFSIGSYSLQLGFNGGTAINPTTTPVTTTPTNPTITTTPTSPATTTTTPTTPTTTTTPTTPVPVTTTAPVSTPAPVVMAPSAPAAPTIAADGYAYNNTFATSTELGAVGQTALGSLTLPTGMSYQVFHFEVAQAGVVYVAVGNANVVVGDAFARPVASGTGLFGFVAPQAGARYYLLFLSSDGGPSANYGFAVNLIPTPPVVIPTTIIPTVTTTTPKVTHVTTPKKGSKKSSR